MKKAKQNSHESEAERVGVIEADVIADRNAVMNGNASMF